MIAGSIDNSSIITDELPAGSEMPPHDMCIGSDCDLNGDIEFHSLRVEGKFHGALICSKGL